jgi:DNA-binding response OmpR family regulator
MPTILSASKDKELLFLRGEVLKLAGFHLVTAMSVEEAIGGLSDSIDLVLIEHTLSPDEALAIAKSAKQFSNGKVGVIAICKSVSQFSRLERDIDECIDSMAKPEELLACVREVLSRA